MASTPLYTSARIHGSQVPLRVVKKRIRQKGYRQVDVARSLGVHQTTISHYLTGKDPFSREFREWVEKNIFDTDTAKRYHDGSAPSNEGTQSTNAPQSSTSSSQGPSVGPQPSPSQSGPGLGHDVPKAEAPKYEWDKKAKAPESDGEFPVDDALKVIRLAQRASEAGHISYPASIRKAIQWQDTFYLLSAEGFAWQDAVVGAYDLVIRSKTEPGSEDRKFAEESFSTVFPFPATGCKIPNGGHPEQHPAYSLALPLARAGKSIWFYGPAGTGKTHTAHEIAGVVNPGKAPYVVQGTGDLTKDDFIGSLGADNGSTVKHYGPAALAAKEGATLIVEEPSVVPAEILMTLQQLVDGKPIVITGMGEVETIVAEEGFNVICCDNTTGLGEGHDYVGTRRMNESFRDRFLFVEYGHMALDQMKDILGRKRSDLFTQQGWA